MRKVLFCGVCVALATPLKDGQVDYLSLDKLIDKIIISGVDAIAVMGTTGEAYGLAKRVQKQVVKHCIEYINKRVIVIVGVCGNTQDAINQAISHQKLGAEGLLVLSPYYNKCT